MPETIDVIIRGSLATIVFIIVSYIFLWRKKNKKAVKTFTIWFVFTVIVALIPISFNVVAVIFRQSQHPALLTVLAKGELLIVSVAVGSDEIGRYFASDTNEIYEIIPACICFVLVISSAFLFPLFATLSPTDTSITAQDLSSTSTFMFFATILSSGVCVLMTEG